MPRARYRVVPVRNGVHQRLEHRPLAVLRALRARGRLCRTHQHTPAHEMQSLGHLLVERPADVACVSLVVDVASLASVAYRLHVGVRQPPLRLARTQQDTGESEPRDPRHHRP